MIPDQIRAAMKTSNDLAVHELSGPARRIPTAMPGNEPGRLLPGRA